MFKTGHAEAFCQKNCAPGRVSSSRVARGHSVHPSIHPSIHTHKQLQTTHRPPPRPIDMLQLEPLSANWSAADPTSAQNLCLLIGRPAGVLRGAAGVLRARRAVNFVPLTAWGCCCCYCWSALAASRVCLRRFCRKHENRSQIVDLGQIRTLFA